MLFVRIGLVLAALTSLAVATSAWVGGFPPEVAVLRGVVGAAAVLAVAYVAELLIATSPPPNALHVERLQHRAPGTTPDNDSMTEVI